MNGLWRDLRVGDKVSIACMPTEFSQPGYYLHGGTLRLYEHLVASRIVLKVSELDEWGLPWVEYTWSTEEGDEEYHFLAVNHNGLERIDDKN